MHRDLSAPLALRRAIVAGDFAGVVHFLSPEDGAFVARVPLVSRNRRHAARPRRRCRRASSRRHSRINNDRIEEPARARRRLTLYETRCCDRWSS